MISTEVQSWQMKAKAPLIVEIPGLNGHAKGRKTLTDSIREAVGINVQEYLIWKNYVQQKFWIRKSVQKA